MDDFLVIPLPGARRCRPGLCFRSRGSRFFQRRGRRGCRGGITSLVADTGLPTLGTRTLIEGAEEHLLHQA